MKKFNILFLPLLLVSSSIHADDKLYSFIGLQTSAVQYENITTPTVGIKYGKQSKNIRTSFTYDYGTKAEDDYHSLMMQIDTGILTNTFSNSILKPYVGLSLGVMQHSDGSITDRGYLYGANIGLTYLLNDVVDLDLGYRFMKTSKLVDLNQIHDLSFSMHYFY